MGISVEKSFVEDLMENCFHHLPGDLRGVKAHFNNFFGLAQLRALEVSIVRTFSLEYSQ